MTDPASTVHVLIDRVGKWHSTPISDDAFQALTAKYPHMPLRYRWVHIPKDGLGTGRQSRAIAAKYPTWATDDVPDLVERIVHREIEHARYHLREGERDAMGFPITEEGRADAFGSRAPEPWAIEEARKALDADTKAPARGKRRRRQRPVAFTHGVPAREYRVGDRCPDSERVIFLGPMSGGDPEYDRCLTCGRVVRVRADGSAPRHTIPSTLRHPA